jgi:hypothetical protein
MAYPLEEQVDVALWDAKTMAPLLESMHSTYIACNLGTYFFLDY